MSKDKAKIHTVKQGDTLFSIAKKYGLLYYNSTNESNIFITILSIDKFSTVQ